MSTPSPVPFGLSGFTTWPLTIAEDLRLCRDADIPYLELCEAKLDAADPAPQLEELKASGLTVSSVQPRMHSPFPDQSRPEPRSTRERMEGIARSVRLFGRHLPGATLISITGAAPNGNYADAYDIAIREYRELARLAADCGVRLALEPLNPILMNVDTFIGSLAHARRIVEAVDHPSFGVFLDVWHFWEDPAAVDRIRSFAGRIFGVHVNDWKNPRCVNDRFQLGDGEIPLVPLLRAIRSTGYTGAYTLEIFSDLRLPDSLWKDPARTAQEGKQRFAELWRQVSLP